MSSESANFGASAATALHGFFDSERMSTDGGGVGGGVVEQTTVVDSVETLTATDSVKATAADVE